MSRTERGGKKRSSLGTKGLRRGIPEGDGSERGRLRSQLEETSRPFAVVVNHDAFRLLAISLRQQTLEQPSNNRRTWIGTDSWPLAQLHTLHTLHTWTGWHGTFGSNTLTDYSLLTTLMDWMAWNLWIKHTHSLLTTLYTHGLDGTAPLDRTWRMADVLLAVMRKQIKIFRLTSTSNTKLFLTQFFPV